MKKNSHLTGLVLDKSRHLFLHRVKKQGSLLCLQSWGWGFFLLAFKQIYPIKTHLYVRVRTIKNNFHKRKFRLRICYFHITWLGSLEEYCFKEILNVKNGWNLCSVATTYRTVLKWDELVQWWQKVEEQMLTEMLKYGKNSLTTA